MKVYVLTAGLDHEGTFYTSVFYNENDANKELEKMKLDRKNRFDWYEVDDFNVE
ncbi:hypothetical protein N9878_01145 [bacterium]|nr:hypothetical protein [bacterium]